MAKRGKKGVGLVLVVCLPLLTLGVAAKLRQPDDPVLALATQGTSPVTGAADPGDIMATSTTSTTFLPTTSTTQARMSTTTINKPVSTTTVTANPQLTIRIAVPDQRPWPPPASDPYSSGPADRPGILWEEQPDGSGLHRLGPVAGPPIYTRDFTAVMTTQQRVRDDGQRSWVETTVFITTTETGHTSSRTIPERIDAPLWLADGEHFAWVGVRRPGEPETNPGDGNDRCAIAVAAISGPVERHYFPCPAHEQIDQIAPAPDGHTFAVVTSNFTGVDPTGHLFLWHLDQATARPAGPPDERVQLPHWSPDGRHLLYVTVPDASHATVNLFDVASAHSRTVHNCERWCTVEWHPDGRTFAVAGKGDGHLDVRIITAATLEQRVLFSSMVTDNRDDITFPEDSDWPVFRSGTGAWSPDGSRLLVRLIRGEGDPGARFPATARQLLAVTVADGHSIPLTDGVGPTWFLRRPRLILTSLLGIRADRLSLERRR